MKFKLLFKFAVLPTMYLCSILIFSNGSLFGQELKNILAPNASLKTLIENEGLQFCEGPVWDHAHQRLLFSDVMASKIYAWNPKKGLSVFKENMPIPTGNKITENGQLIHCSGGMRGLVAIDLETGKDELLVNQINGKKLNSPNDLVIKSDGTIWFSDPDHGLSFTGQEAELTEKGVYRYHPDTKKITLLDISLNQPNGIAFSPDESILYVAVAPTPQEYEADPEGVERSVWAYDISPDQKVINARKIIDIGPSTWGVDGMKVDSQGNLYLTSGSGVKVYDAKGSYLGLIDTAEKEVVNLAFGGEDFKTLFILGHQELFSIDLKNGKSIN